MRTFMFCCFHTNEGNSHINFLPKVTQVGIKPISSDSNANTVAIPCCPCTLSCPLPSPRIQAASCWRASECFLGCTAQQSFVCLCACVREWDWCGGVAASHFNFHFWIFPNYYNTSWVPVGVLKSLFKNFRKEPSEEYLLYEKWTSVTMNLVFIFSLCFHYCSLQKVLYSLSVEIAGGHAILMVISFCLA